LADLLSGDGMNAFMYRLSLGGSESAHAWGMTLRIGCCTHASLTLSVEILDLWT
jgi:hypothetical protein